MGGGQVLDDLAGDDLRGWQVVEILEGVVPSGLSSHVRPVQ